MHLRAPTAGGLSFAGIRALLFDREGNLWVGSLGGLNLLRRGASSLVSYQNSEDDPHSLSSNSVVDLYEDREGRLWVGTLGGGLNLFDRKTETFTAYKEFPSNVIFQIEEDDSARLWLSTNHGISRFNPETAGIESFDLANGLQSLQFHMGAGLRTRSGRILLGSIDGFYDFDPESIKPDSFAPPVVITSLRISNQMVKLPTALTTLDEITFSPEDKIFSFEFAALDYALPRRNHYAYLLEGFNDKWIELGAKREVTFTNLDPGTYVFRVKASNSDAVWSEASTVAIRIIVRPPFWQTWWFRGLLLLTFLLALVAVHRLRVRRLEADIADRKHAEEVLRRSSEEISDLYNNAPCGYHSLDKNGTFIRINDTELRWLGYSREEVIGKMKIGDVITPESPMPLS
jgi:PAS domain-containing protein